MRGSEHVSFNRYLFGVMVIENSCICKFTNPPDVDNVIAVGLVTHLTEHKISIGFWGNLHLCEPNGKGVCAVSCLALLKTQGKANQSFALLHKSAYVALYTNPLLKKSI